MSECEHQVMGAATAVAMVVAVAIEMEVAEMEAAAMEAAAMEAVRATAATERAAAVCAAAATAMAAAATARVAVGRGSWRQGRGWLWASGQCCGRAGSAVGERAVLWAGRQRYGRADNAVGSAECGVHSRDAGSGDTRRWPIESTHRVCAAAGSRLPIA